MKILIVRHAESANNVLSMVSYDLYIQNRSTDPNLTETGIMQVKLK
jgi:broad specificity phosphatase PhoE